MSTFLAILFLLAFVVIVPLYVMYFSVLLDFGRDFQRLHPDVYVRLVGAGPPSFFSSSRTYKLLRAVQSGKDVGEPLEPALLVSYRSVRRYLLTALSCFMVLVLSGLAHSVMSSGV